MSERQNIDMFHPQGPTLLELAHQALSSTERGYDLLAPKFDYTPFRTPNWILDRVAAHLAASGPIDCGLDICCGTGAGMQMLRPLCHKKVVGIDLSERMLDVCREKTMRTPGSAEVVFMRGNVLAMPFNAEFDVAVCFGALGHILPRDESRFLQQVYNALIPGGRFVFVTSYLPSRWSFSYWLARGFNGAMRLRNALIRPPFIMYYLTFLLPEIQHSLELKGFTVEVRDNCFAPQAKYLKLVIATRNH